MTGRRVVVVLSTLEMGGAERQALHLVEHLRGDAQVSVLGLSRHGLAAEQLRQMGVPFEVVPFRWPCRMLTLLRTLPRVYLALRRLRPEVLVGYTIWANVVTGLLGPLTGARVRVWGQRGMEPDPLRGSRLARAALRRCNIYVANSATAAARLTACGGLGAGAVCVVGNGVAPQRPRVDRNAWYRTNEIDSRRPLVGMVANFRPEKDHARLIDAWAAVVEATPEPPLLLLAGADFAMVPALREQIVRLNLAAHVRLLGQVEDVSSLLGALNVGVLTSRSESCPNAVLEYMAAGLPVCGSDIPAIRELLAPENRDLLAPVDDVAGLTRSLLRLLADEPLRQRLGAANRARAEAEFSVPRMLEEMQALLAQGLRA